MCVKQGLIIKLPKKGDLTECSNWRGITLLNTIGKILAIIIHNRLKEELEPKMRPGQAGFRSNKACADHINTLRIIVEQSIQRPKNRWEDDVKSDITRMKITNWKDCIRNWTKWKKLSEKAKTSLKL